MAHAGRFRSPLLEQDAKTPTICVAGNVNVDLILGTLAEWPRIGTETILPHSELRVGGQAGKAISTSGVALVIVTPGHGGQSRGRPR